jgi:UDP-glucose 4-epimerase
VKIIITGSNGFLGSSFGRHAAHHQHQVLGIARASQPAPGWTGEHAQADALNSDLAEIIKRFAPDVLLHAAGTASVGASLKSPLDDLRASVMTWANVLDSVRRSGVRPLVLFPSSAAVYGNPAEQPVREEMSNHPISPYGFHKSACELLAREYADCFGLRIIVCRFFSLFGAAQRRLFVWEIYRQLVSGNAELEGTGKEIRDYLHIGDAASALLNLAKVSIANNGAGDLLTINVASGIETRMIDLAEQIRGLVAPQKEIRCRGHERPGDPNAWCADISRLRSLIPHWQPRPLTQGLAECLADWQSETANER